MLPTNQEDREVLLRESGGGFAESLRDAQRDNCLLVVRVEPDADPNVICVALDYARDEGMAVTLVVGSAKDNGGLDYLFSKDSANQGREGYVKEWDGQSLVEAVKAVRHEDGLLVAHLDAECDPDVIGEALDYARDEGMVVSIAALEDAQARPQRSR
jgi:hypothetical protein